MTTLASNKTYNDDVPVVIEDADNYPFAPGERERDWHEASDAEYQAYINYWNRHYAEVDR